MKPVRWGVPDAQLDQVKSFGVKTFEDFTWKHMLDFYSCADCGRCSDHCPANAVGRPLSPRFLTIKARDYVFRHYPVLGSAHNGEPLVGGIYSEDEIWSCTTCGACEAECPLAGRVHRQDRRFAARNGRRRQGAPIAAKAAEGAGEPRQSLRQDGKKEGRLGEGQRVPANLRGQDPERKPAARTPCTSSTASLPTTTGCSRSGEPRRESWTTSERTSESSAPRKKIAATMSGGSAKRCCSWPCAITMRRPSKHPESSGS